MTDLTKERESSVNDFHMRIAKVKRKDKRRRRGGRGRDLVLIFTLN